MTRWTTGLLVLGLVSAWLAMRLMGIESSSVLAGPQAQQPAPHSAAVVELFTSEGCSSCPPADQLLADLIREAKSNGQPVYALAFHVGYWDGLGWKDPFSDPAYTQRQLNYAAALKLDDVYTPQMIVNGTAQFVGSDRQAAREAIDRALRQSASAAVEFQAVQSHSAQSQAGNDGPGRPIDLTYRAAGPKGAVLNVAVVEGSLRVDVPRGENGGRQLEWFADHSGAAANQAGECRGGCLCAGGVAGGDFGGSRPGVSSPVTILGFKTRSRPAAQSAASAAFEGRALHSVARSISEFHPEMAR